MAVMLVLETKLKTPEIGDIFRVYGDAYRQKREGKIPAHILKTMRGIQDCRTAVLGGHQRVCADCGTKEIAYNSCRNRHCPKCQTLSKERWIEGQKASLLNIGYFHVVFTIPDSLNPVAFQNQKAVYNILFKAVSETLTELAADPKHLGAQIGFTSILHTWGQNLMHHPHIHCVVPDGGIAPDGGWVNAKHQDKKGKEFLIPVRVLSRKFRGKFLYYLKLAYKNGELNFYGQQTAIGSPGRFQNLLASLYAKEWYVYCKRPFTTTEAVIEYLGRYTHRVAISNNRIVSCDDGKVRFKWRDNKDGAKLKVMEIRAEEFIRRFLIHVLPPRFMKIRHYGLLGNRNKKEKVALCKELTNTHLSTSSPNPTSSSTPNTSQAGIGSNDSQAQTTTSTPDLILKITGIDITKCRACGSGSLYKVDLANKTQVTAPPNKASPITLTA